MAGLQAKQRSNRAPAVREERGASRETGGGVANTAAHSALLFGSEQGGQWSEGSALLWLCALSAALDVNIFSPKLLFQVQ